MPTHAYSDKYTNSQNHININFSILISGVIQDLVHNVIQRIINHTSNLNQ